MRLLVILTAVSAVIAIPIPARPKKDRQGVTPPKEYQQWDENNRWGNERIAQPNTQSNPDAKTNPDTGSGEPSSDGTPIDEVSIL